VGNGQPYHTPYLIVFGILLPVLEFSIYSVVSQYCLSKTSLRGRLTCVGNLMGEAFRGLNDISGMVILVPIVC
jgi:hypothetical protein